MHTYPVQIRRSLEELFHVLLDVAGLEVDIRDILQQPGFPEKSRVGKNITGCNRKPGYRAFVISLHQMINHNEWRRLRQQRKDGFGLIHEE